MAVSFRLDPEYGDIKAKIRKEKEAWAELEAKQKHISELVDMVVGVPPQELSKMKQRYSEAYGMSSSQFAKVFHESKPINKVLLLL